MEFIGHKEPRPESPSIAEIGVALDQSVRSLQAVTRQIKAEETSQASVEELYHYGQKLTESAREQLAILRHSIEYYPSYPPDKIKFISWDSLAIEELEQELEKSYFNKIAKNY